MKKWKKKLKQATVELSSGDYPVWWDGFRNVLVHRETSDWTDNPYLEAIEQLEYKNYKAGAMAAESLLAHQYDE
jgi:hypothetical protein|tara:strand:- start:455 stop:676 length:222 start_codon:yes stop_codon:yes gene_type:complete